MDPTMLQIGPLALKWYGFLIAMGVLAGTILGLKFAEDRSLDPEKLLDMAVYLVISGIIGARLVYVLTSPSNFFGPNGDFLSVFKVWQGGISIHGGILGVILATWGYSRIHKLNMLAYLDVMVLIGAFGIIGGRIGNIMNGTDTGGRLTDLAIGFNWPAPGTQTFGKFGEIVFGKNLWQFWPPACNASIPQGQACSVHFTQFYGVIIGVVLVALMYWILKTNKTPGYAFFMFLIWYSVLRAVVEETFRDNPLFWQVYLNNSAGIGFFTLTQLASIVIILISVYALFTLKSK